MAEKNKLLIIGHLPPPVHGVSAINSWIKSSPVINHEFEIQFINLSLAGSIADIGGFSLKKIVRAGRTLFAIVKTLHAYTPSLVVYNISPDGFAFFRDVFFTSIIKLFGLKLCYYIHGKGFAKHTANSKIYAFLSARMFQGAYLVCLSASLTSDVERYRHRGIFILNNGIPGPTQLKYDNAENKKVTFLFLSNYVISKGVLDFLKAFAIVRKQTNKEFGLILTGKEYDLSIDQINIFVRENGLENNALITGALYDADKTNIFSNSDVLVLPTYYQNECFPLVILEAFQHSLPVISSYEGAIPEIIKEALTGFLVPSKNPQRLAEIILSIINNPAQLNNMRTNVVNQFNQLFSFSVFERNFIATFKEILGH